ncbi:MAG TPA: 30S ribosomal protein S9 [Phycisphaerae bacterium]|nr:30S ribosomal protein S9 [Phycisphaerae bacterium]
MIESTTTSAPAAETPATNVVRRSVVSVGGKTFYWGTGRRKKSVARVRITPGEGKFLINDRNVDKFFTEAKDRQYVNAPLAAANMAGKFDIFVTVQGGGHTGQAGAIVQGMGRAISLYDAALRKPLQEAGCLTRDSRMKERKKYGLRGARRAFQFSKR